MRTRSRIDGALARQIQTLYNLGTLGDLTDGQLLERFATETDEVAELAFAAMVERHQAMVWRACRAIAGDQHAAEDAFQATFLVLVRRARSLWVRDSIGPWLHQVACRTASCLRSRTARRRRHERRCAESQAGRFVAAGTDADPDRDAAIHQEIHRLPEKYRAPIVLCDLQGQTHREAARSLGWPIGTVKSRQMQGRRLLRDRLAARGLAPAVALAVVESLRQSAVAAIPRELSRAAAAAAMTQAARLSTGLAISPPILILTREVLRAMLWNRLRLIAILILAAGFASGGAGVYVIGSQEPTPKAGAQAPPTVRAGRTTAATPDDPAARLRAQRLAVRKARATYEIARLNREIAEIAVEEYRDVTYPREMAAVDSEIKLAKSDATRAEDRLDWAKRMFEKGYVSKATLTSEELNQEKSKFALEAAQSEKHVLEKYTRDKTIKELQGEVKKARMVEEDKLSAWEGERIKEAEMHPQQQHPQK